MFPELLEGTGEGVVDALADAETGGVEVGGGAGQGGAEGQENGRVQRVADVVLGGGADGGHGELRFHARDGKTLADAVDKIPVAQEEETADAVAVGEESFFLGRADADDHRAVAVLRKGGVARAVADLHLLRQVAAVPAGHGGGGKNFLGLLVETLLLVARQLFAQGGGIRAEGQLVPRVIADPDFGDILRRELAPFKLIRVAEFLGTLADKLRQGSVQRAVRLEVVPQLKEIRRRLGDGHEEGAQILRERAEQHLHARGEPRGHTPLREPVGEVFQLVDVDTEGRAVIRFVGGVVVVHGVLLPRDGDFIRVEVGGGVVLPGVDAVLVRNFQEVRVGFLRLVSPESQQFFGIDVAGNALVEEAVDGGLAPDEVAAAQLVLGGADLLAHVREVRQEGRGVAQLHGHDTVAYHDVACALGVVAGVADAAAVHEREPAAGDALLGVDHARGFVPRGIVRMVRAELRGDLLHPSGVQHGGAAHVETGGFHQLRAHEPIRAFAAAEEPAAGENREIAPARAAVDFLF